MKQEAGCIYVSCLARDLSRRDTVIACPSAAQRYGYQKQTSFPGAACQDQQNRPCESSYEHRVAATHILASAVLTIAELSHDDLVDAVGV
jgi:hypothetical protein